MCGSHNLDKNIFCFYYYYLCRFSGIKGTPFQVILNTHLFPSFRDFKAILLPLFLLLFFPLAQSPSPLLSLNSHHLQPEHHFPHTCRPTSFLIVIFITLISSPLKQSAPPSSPFLLIDQHHRHFFSLSCLDHCNKS